MKIKALIQISALIISLVLLVYYLSKNIQDFNRLSLVSPTLLLPLILIILTMLFLNGILNKNLLHSFKIHLSNFEAFGLSVITSFYNLITPFRGGAGVRAVYLKKKYNFAYVHFLATLSAIYIIIFLIGSFGGIFSMGLIYLKTKIFNPLIFLIFAGMFLSLLLIIIFSPKLKDRKNKWANRFIKVINGWHLIKNNKKIILITALISSLQLILGAINTLILYKVFGVEISFAGALFIAAISSISILVAITPGNLGIGDAISVFSATIIGIGTTEAIAATVLGRAINLLVIFILGPIFSYMLLKKK